MTVFFSRAAAAAIVAVLLWAPSASAWVREVRTFTNAPSINAKGSPANHRVTFNLSGNYTLGTIHIVATWTNPGNTASRPNHGYMRIRRPDGAFFDVRVSMVSSWVSNGTTLISADDRLGGINPAGEWEIEFYESIVNVPDEPDAVWSSFRLEFEDDAGGPNGADVTLCQVYGLTQYGRSGDTVGLALGTTSWNVGTRNLIWRAAPDPGHPFIAMNLYRRSAEGRFEQIGQSWLKHGFFALSDTQCGGFCHTTSGRYLGVGCTDTYTPATNAVQSSLGPRFEIDPWKGEFAYNGSILQTGIPGGDNPITRRLQVHDHDLDPAQNEGAQYFMEAIYIARDDADIMNNAAWKPVTPVGQPGGTWSFDQTSQTSPPTIGFAIDTIPGAVRTTLAQMFPVMRPSAPDGRCLLAMTAAELPDGRWRYEYALMNVDMARQAGAFEVPVPASVDITDIDFSAPHHHNEPYNLPLAQGGVPIDNQPWTAERTTSSVRWSTDTNPLRWGSLYTFGFIANTPPADAEVTLTHFTPGLVMTVSGLSRGPSEAPMCMGDANKDGTVDFADIVAILGHWGGGGPMGDATGSGTIGFDDIVTVLSNWGAQCAP